MNLTSTYQLLQFILGLAALIVLHEFGHFIVARLLKVEVEEFGIGFPPRLTKLFRAGGTDFTLNWIPLGGFVRPKGENDPTIEGGLAASSPWVRLGVLLAGPGMNILIGVLMGIWLFQSLGDPITSIVKIESVTSGSPAALAGIQSGDVITAVNSTKIDSFEILQSTIAANLGKPVQITFEHNGQPQTVSLTPRNPPPADQGAMGVILTHPTRPINLLTAVYRSGDAVYQNTRAILLLPIRLIRGQASPQEGRLVGYKGMFDIYQQVQSVLGFFMMISISLGIGNLLPIPALDGGRILLTLPELLIRKRIPANLENAIHMVGFALLIVLILYINLQDFINPIKMP